MYQRPASVTAYGPGTRRADSVSASGLLSVESVVEGILVTGRVEADTALECSRCLKEFKGRAVVEVCEMVYSKVSRRPALYMFDGQNLFGDEGTFSGG